MYSSYVNMPFAEFALTFAGNWSRTEKTGFHFEYFRYLKLHCFSFFCFTGHCLDWMSRKVVLVVMNLVVLHLAAHGNVANYTSGSQSLCTHIGSYVVHTTYARHIPTHPRLSPPTPTCSSGRGSSESSMHPSRVHWRLTWGGYSIWVVTVVLKYSEGQRKSLQLTKIISS